MKGIIDRKAVTSILALMAGVAWGQAESTAVIEARELSRAFRSAAQKVVPSVVTVVSRSEPGPRRMLRDGIRILPERFPDEFDEGSIGSGVVIHSSGLVLTNSHVIAGAGSVIVRLADGREYEVADIKRDSYSDIALLKLQDAPELPVAKLGNSDELEIGDWVLAIGSPFELEATVSAGIISGKERSVSKIKRGKLLQTDAAINPGNSGGPLVNLNGEVIGINVAIASSSGGYQGIGFAIPSSQVRWVVQQLARYGKVRRAYLGVEIGDFEMRDAQRAGLPPMTGVKIARVAPDGPAATAGLQPDDVIIEFDGSPVRDSRDLQGLVEQRTVGNQYKIKVLRNGQARDLEVVLAELGEK